MNSRSASWSSPQSMARMAAMSMAPFDQFRRGWAPRALFSVRAASPGTLKPCEVAGPM